jgi:hypothetical protein
VRIRNRTHGSRPEPRNFEIEPRNLPNEPRNLAKRTQNRRAGASVGCVRVLPHDPDHEVAAIMRRTRVVSREPRISMGARLWRVRVLAVDAMSGGPAHRAQEAGIGGRRGAGGQRGEADLAGRAEDRGVARFRASPRRPEEMRHGRGTSNRSQILSTNPITSASAPLASALEASDNVGQMLNLGILAPQGGPDDVE